MARINVYSYDDLGQVDREGWFNSDSATRYGEDTEWNGNNHISVNTGTQWDHEEMYRTSQGRWVLGRYSNWEGSTRRYEYVAPDVARTWLIRNDHDDAVNKWFGPVEEERGPGRPEVGPAFSLRFPEDLLARVDAKAKADGISRAEEIRRLVEAGL